MKSNLNTAIAFKSIALSIFLTIGSIQALAGKGSDGGADKPLFDGFLNSKSPAVRMQETILNQAMDQKIARDAEMLRQRVESKQFKTDLIELVQSQEFVDSIQDRSSQEILRQMLTQGLVEDIQNSEYLVNDICYDADRTEKFLSTKIGIRGAPICVSPKNFYKAYYKDKGIYKVSGNLSNLALEQVAFYAQYPEWQIMALFIHDHARHFNFVTDDNHSFAAAVAMAIYDYPRIEAIQDPPSSSDWFKGYVVIRVGGDVGPDGLTTTVDATKDPACSRIAEKRRSVLERSGDANLVQTITFDGKSSSANLTCLEKEIIGSNTYPMLKFAVSVRTKSGRALGEYIIENKNQISKTLFVVRSHYKITGEYDKNLNPQ